MAATIPPDSSGSRVVRLSEQHDAINLGCGNDHRDGMLNVDAVPECQPDLVVDLNQDRWPFPADSFDRILASHVIEHLDDTEHALRECSRILRPGGTLDVRLPVGLDMQADPDHIQENEWTWLTPEFYCGQRHWDIDIGLTVADREVDLWSALNGVEHYLYQAYIDWRRRKFGAGRWCFGMPATSGEYRIVFEKPTEGDR